MHVWSGRARVYTQMSTVTLHGAAEERRNTEYEVDNNPKAVSEVIEDNMFWSFLDMLLVLAGPIRSFLAWLQRCRCHPSARLGKLCGFVMTQIEKLKVAPPSLLGLPVILFALYI